MSNFDDDGDVLPLSELRKSAASSSAPAVAIASLPAGASSSAAVSATAAHDKGKEKKVRLVYSSDDVSSSLFFLGCFM